jgi:hypothetical protein
LPKGKKRSSKSDTVSSDPRTDKRINVEEMDTSRFRGRLTRGNTKRKWEDIEESLTMSCKRKCVVQLERCVTRSISKQSKEEEDNIKVKSRKKRKEKMM